MKKEIKTKQSTVLMIEPSRVDGMQQSKAYFSACARCSLHFLPSCCCARCMRLWWQWQRSSCSRALGLRNHKPQFRTVLTGPRWALKISPLSVFRKTNRRSRSLWTVSLVFISIEGRATLVPSKNKKEKRCWMVMEGVREDNSLD